MHLSPRTYTLWDAVRIPLRIAPVLTLLRALDRLIMALLPSLQVLLTARFVDTAISIASGGGTRADVVPYLLLLMGTVAYTYVSGALMRLVNERLKMKLAETLRAEAVAKRARLDYRHIESNDTWELINRAATDPAERIFGALNNVMALAELIVRIVSMLAVLATQIWWLALVVIACAVPLYRLAVRSGKRTYDTMKEVKKQERRADYLREVLSARESTDERTLFGYSRDVDERWNERFETARVLSMRTHAKMFVSMKGSSLLVVALSVAIIGLLIPSLRAGGITIGIFIGLVTGLLDMVQMMSWELMHVTSQLASHREYMKDLTAFAALEETADATCAANASARREPASIEFRDVTFRYPGTDHDILKGLSLTLEAGRHYAFVGVNGAGKTTITKLLTGLYDGYEGDILVDGRSVRDMPQADIKALFAVVYQDFARYQVTARDNLRLGDSACDAGIDARVEAAVDALHLREAVERLPQGLDTPLGKAKAGGVDLSGGEWQRLAIARSLVGGAPVHILDEPTAALDPQAESDIYKLFGEISGGKLTLFITHRLGAARLADEILVIDGGAVAERGSHDELMARGGIYRDMFEAQRSWYR